MMKIVIKSNSRLNTVSTMNFITIVLLLLVTKYCRGKQISRIRGGRDAQSGIFPYVVRQELLNYHNSYQEHVCTGTAIAPTWTITAAHCVDFFSNLPEHYKPLIVYGAVSRVPQHNDSIVDVISWFMHPSYSSELFNDVALIKSQPMMLPQYGKISAVHYKALVGLEVVTAGYGVMQVNDTETLTYKEGNTRVVMKPLQLANYVLKKCIYNHLQPSLCLSPVCGGDYFVCPGDSGGPTIHHSGVVAVSSMSTRIPDCYRSKFLMEKSFNHYSPKEYEVGIVAPLSPHLDWIMETMINN